MSIVQTLSSLPPHKALAILNRHIANSVYERRTDITKGT
jgi:hypothetical protein